MQLDMTDALCTQTDPEVFFGDKVWEIEAAKKVCRQCPLMESCLDLAMRDNIAYGVWGGATPEERMMFKREPRRKLKHIYIDMGRKLNDFPEEKK